MTTTQTNIGPVSEFPAHLGQCVKVGETQIAVFYLPDSEQKWFAVQNFNPQNQRMVLSRGIVGDEKGIPFIACPLHKYKYSLIHGECLTDTQYSLTTYNLTIEGDHVFLEL